MHAQALPPALFVNRTGARTRAEDVLTSSGTNRLRPTVSLDESSRLVTVSDMRMGALPCCCESFRRPPKNDGVGLEAGGGGGGGEDTGGGGLGQEQVRDPTVTTYCRSRRRPPKNGGDEGWGGEEGEGMGTSSKGRSFPAAASARRRTEVRKD